MPCMPPACIAHQDGSQPLSVAEWLDSYYIQFLKVEQDPLQIMLYHAVPILSEQVRNIGDISELGRAGSWTWLYGILTQWSLFNFGSLFPFVLRKSIVCLRNISVKSCCVPGTRFSSDNQCWLAVSFAELKLAGSKYDRDHASLLLYCGAFLTVGGTLWAFVSSCRTTQSQLLCKNWP